MENIRKIDRQQVEDVVALSPMQEGMLFHYLKNPESDQYFQQFQLILSGVIDVARFRAAWQWVVDTNEMLRTIFAWERVEKPVQIVLKQIEVSIQTFDLSFSTPEEQENALADWMAAERKHKFHLRTGPLFRIGLCQLSVDRWVMLVSSHHIIFDGWSHGVILKEFFTAYETLFHDQPLRQVKKNKFKEYIKWIQRAPRQQGEEFWKRYLEGFDTHTELPVDMNTGGEMTKVEHYRYPLGQSLQTALSDLTREERVTLGAILYAAWGVVLQKYTCQRDIIFGTPVSGRPVDLPGVEEMVGLFINTLPLRVKTTGNETVAELLHSIQNAVQARQPYERTPLTELMQNHLQGGLFQTIVVVENYPLDQLTVQTGLMIQSYSTFEMTNFDLTVSVLPFAEMELDLAYHPDRFTERAIAQICQHFVQILTAMAACPWSTISELDMLTVEERTDILQRWNDPHQLAERTLPEYFEEKAARFPEKIALVQGDQKMTFGELNQAANQLARRLRELGVGPDQLVGLMVERSFAMLIGIMGILKAGGGYLPLDPSYPRERIHYLLQDSGICLLLTTEAWKMKMSESGDPEGVFEGEIIALDEEGFLGGDTSDLPLLARPEHLAYVIYTSGSTGQPKGVMIEHRNVVNLLLGMEQEYPVGETDALLLKTACTFDVSVAELFGWFMGYGRLVLLEPGEEKDPLSILRTIEREKVTHVNFVASMLGVLLASLTPERARALSEVKYIIQAGERLPQEMAKRFYELIQGPRLENLYGPTETTVYGTRYPVSQWDGRSMIPIGQPLPNYRVYVLDLDGHLQPDEVVGEIWIGGAGVARGYLGRSELTAEKFLPNTFGAGRMYRTGDLGRWLPNGQLEFVGRMDHQVKIRGYRIELGEIEARLLQIPGITDAVVLDRIDRMGEKYLCAYVVFTSTIQTGAKTIQPTIVENPPLSVADLRVELGKVLPEYMIPTHFIVLATMPHLSHGKVDRKALLAMEVEQPPAREYVAPTTETEERLAGIWAQVLGVSPVGVYDHFFALGGHSLKAASAIAKIGKEFGREIPLKILFERPTVKEMAEWVDMTELDLFAPILSVEERPYYPVTSAQRRLWVLHQLNAGDTSYNISGAMRVQGTLDGVRLADAIRQLMARHEALRTSFIVVDGEVVQRIQSDLNVPISYHYPGDVGAQHARGSANSVKSGEAERAVTLEQRIRDFIQPFDLAIAPLFRIEVVEGNEGDLILVDMHHIIADGVSLEMMLKELGQLYNGDLLPPVQVQYKDYAVWQREFLQSEKMQVGEAYWRERFSGEIPVLNLPTDRPRPAVQSYCGKTFPFVLRAELTTELRRFAQTQGVTLYMLLLAGFTLLLSRYSGQDDLAVGTPVAGRPHADIQDTIGMFVNTVVMRNRPQSRKRFTDFLQEVKTVALDAFTYQDYPLEMLIDSLKLERDLSRNPLFDVMFILQNTQRADRVIGEPQFLPFALERGTAKFDLTLEAVEQDGEIACQLEYRTDLFTWNTMERMAGHFRQILQEVVSSSELLIRDIDMLTPEERQMLLRDWNGTERDVPDLTLAELFEAQVERTPEATAVIAGEQVLTYRTLHERANQLGRLLRSKGVQPNEAVGIMVGRKAELILGIWGILKAGAAYLPLDPEYPMERTRYMLENSQVRIVLTDDREVQQNAGESERWVEEIDITRAELFPGESSPLGTACKPSDLAYILYTSGSTGKPKGVMIEHRAVVNFLHGFIEVIDLSEVRTVVCTTTVSFDIFVVESLLPLVLGLRMVLANEEEQRLFHQLHALLVRHEVDLLQMTPSRMHYFLQNENTGDGLARLKVIIVGGEPLTKTLLEELRAKTRARLYNEYGPTEATVWAMYKDVTTAEEITIGKPLPNYQVYVINADLRPLPIQVPGELCIGGQSLARGYCQRPDLTEEKWIANPFGQPGEKMYRTGDLVCWRSDGEIEFLGRIDFQVKIRGFRIELGEIENQLLRYPGITEAVVIAKEDTLGTHDLIGYVIGEGRIDFADVKDHLAGELPEYMIPAYLMQLETWPLTPNGKIDRKALPDVVDAVPAEQNYVAPISWEEERLTQIWAEVLQVERVGVLDDFFALGGHSLKAASVASRIARDFGVELPLREIFKLPTVRAMARWVQERMANQDELSAQIDGAIPVQAERTYYPTSSAQKRIFVLQQLAQDTSYNMPAVLKVEGPLDLARLEQAFARLIERHESLRTSFALVNGEPVQKIHSQVSFAIQWQTETVEADAVQDWAMERMRRFVQPFDLGQAPLLRVNVSKIGEEEHVLFFDMHHMISDGTSMGILTEELARLYAGQELPALRIQYKDYAVWQNEFVHSEEWRRKESFWLAQFADEVPVLNLPTDEPRPSLQSFAGVSVKFTIPPELRDQLQQFAQQEGVTLYMMLLACYSIVLGRYSGQTDVVVGSPIAGRLHPDLENIIGMFANTLAMRNRPETAKTFRAFLAEVKANALQAFENQDYAFEMLVEQLPLQRSLSRNPLFDTLFVLQNTRVGRLTGDHLRFTPLTLESVTAKFDLTLSVVETDVEIVCDLEYATSLFRRETIVRLGMHWMNTLQEVLADPEIILGEITMISPEERGQFLREDDAPATARLIHLWFEEQAARTADQIALNYEGITLTYGELNAKANQLARQLRERGVGRDQVVGLMVDRSLDLVIGILAVLKAGGAYLPIDPEYPLERIQYILEDSKASILLTQAEVQERREQGLHFTGTRFDLGEQVYFGETANLEPINQPQDLLYVIYTSGSTGKPKGVMLEHRQLANLLAFEFEHTELHFKKVLQFTTISFDVSFQEIFSTLLSGGELYLISQERRNDPKGLFEWIEAHEIQTVFMPVAFLQFVFTEEEYAKRFPHTVRDIVTAGEQLIVSDRFRTHLRKHGVYLHNHYGPSETHVATALTLHPDGEIPELPTIGRPIRHTQVYIVNEQMRLQPIGVEGEIYIGGACVGRGYLGRADLTAERFIPSPFRESERLYQTGDRGRWLAHGEIEFRGRSDQQVKIRGFRVEPSEVESALLKHPAVREAVVVAREDAARMKYLGAYVVTQYDLSAATLREHVKQGLPDYMIPASIQFLEALPLTPSGKLDRRALPIEVDNVESEEQYIPPRNRVEEGLQRIWQDLLHVSRIGVEEDFFALGGHSLRAMSMISRVAQEFQVELPLREIFKAPTIAGVARYIAGAQSRLFAAIQPVEEREWYPTSSTQKRIYVMHQLNEEDTSYNMPGIFRVEGHLDVERLEASLQMLMQRQESLRTTFEVVAGETMQRIHREVPFSVEILDLRKMGSGGQVARSTGSADSQDGAGGLPEQAMRQWIRPFDLQHGPLFRVDLVRGDHEEWLFFDMHHIISDGTSLGILANEVMQLYHGKAIPDLRVQYKDYAVWQQEMFHQNLIQKQAEYWFKRFAGEIPVLNLPTDEPRPAIQRYEGDVAHFILDQKQTRKIYTVTAQYGATLYMVLLSVYHLLLAKYSGQEEIVIGSPVAERPHADLESIIGVFINTVALRNRSESSMAFEEFLGQVKENTLAAFEHQNYPFEMLIEGLPLKRDLSRNPLFDVMLILQHTAPARWMDQDLQLKPCDFSPQVAKFDLTLSVEERDGQIHCALEYSTALYHRPTIQRMVAHFLEVLHQVTEEPKIRLADVQMLTPAERERILYQWNDTEMPYGREKTIHQLFEEQVMRMPDVSALTFGDQTLTYRELNVRADQLARHLRYQGIGADDIVAILLPRSVELILGMLAVLKAGGAYLPIDPEYPLQRMTDMLEDSGTRIILTNQVIANNDITLLDITHPMLYSAVESDVSTGDRGDTTSHRATDLAYVIYTSGSTGKPKGVMVEHRAVSNFITGVSQVIPFAPQQKILSLTTVSFDIFVLETWLPFALGLHIVLASEEEQREPELLAKVLTGHRVDLLQATPSRIQLLFSNERSQKALTNLKVLMIGGEAFPAPLLERLQKMTHARLYNMYGPTETTVWSLIKDLTDVRQITLGRPIANTQVYILDQDRVPVPEGVPGELYIAGEGIARGYLHRPELTRERFVVNPFARTSGFQKSLDQGELNRMMSQGELPETDPQKDAEPTWSRDSLMYRTGDRVQWTADGELLFLGRVDHQVKIRGYRIELGEIETQLRKHPQIQDVVVVPQRVGEDVLCAYYVLKKPAMEHVATEMAPDATIGELRAELAKTLPDYMLPSYFIQLEQLPLTPNGKVDRAALPKVETVERPGQTYVAPTDELEEMLAQIWAEILHVERVGLDDHFFEMGGHSLKGTYMVAQIAQQLGVQVPLREIFIRPTLRELADWVRKERKVEQMCIPQLEVRPYYPASSAQKRMYVVQHILGDETSYNLPTAVLLKGKIDVERVIASISTLIQRHEALRTSCVQVGGELMQVIHEDVDGFFHQETVDEEMLQQRMAEFIQPFDLGKAPLFRAALWKIRGQADQHILLFDMHHIISDGTSLGILTREWMDLYQGHTLQPLPIQYKDFAVWQNEFLQSEALQKQELYWVNRFRDEIPVLHLPTDDVDHTTLHLAGATYSLSVQRDLIDALVAVCKREQATLYMILLAAYNILLAKYAGQEEIVVGSPISGRSIAQTQSVVGMFVNTLAMRNQPTGEKPFTPFLREVRENALEAYANQDYPFERLVDTLQLERDLNRNPLFNVVFSLQNFEMIEAQVHGVEMRTLPLTSDSAKFDLSLIAIEGKDAMTFHWEYRTRLFTGETVARMARHFVQILWDIVTNPDQPLAQIQMLSPVEREELLHRWNRTGIEGDPAKTVVHSFVEQVGKTPDVIAVLGDDTGITYLALNERANQWAQRLRQRGLLPEERVGLLVERSVDLIAGILAIWKAGGAYVPLDPEYPADRLRFMIHDSGVRLLLTQTHWIGKVTVPGEVLDLHESLSDEFIEGPDRGQSQSANQQDPLLVNPDRLAYIIYTSGTTGQPKGVMVEHRSIANTLEWRKREYRLTTEDRVLQLFSFAFDGFLTSCFTPLISGATLIMLNGEQAKDPLAIRQVIVAEKVTHFIAVPSLYGILLECLTSEAMTSLRKVTLAGEAVTPNLVQRSKDLHVQVELINEYGPTENSVVSTYMRDLKPEDRITIGHPIANTQVYLLDRYFHLLPVGVPGEICVSGIGLARGYLNLPEMTAERFVQHPFRIGERLYRTGDRGRRLPDGRIEFMGRVDEQVKIRGFRIELGEIRNQLLKHPVIRDAIVIDREDATGQMDLVAYYVSDRELRSEEFTEFLGKVLPGYMMPSHFVWLDRIPLTSNGKIDRKALPEVEVEQCEIRQDADVSLMDHWEERLAAIWCEVLSVKQVRGEDHFFERGGHSLKAMQLATMVLREFQVELSIRTIFQSPTLSEMAQQIRRAVMVEGYTAIPRASVQPYYPVSSAQKRLYILDQLLGVSTSYNMTSYMIVEGELDCGQLTLAVEALVARHEVFRTSFTMMNDEPVQVIQSSVPIRIEYQEFNDLDAHETSGEALQRAAREFVRPFDLTKAPLFRVGLVRIDQQHLVMLDMHHIISDGTSMSILIRELIQLYAGKELPEPQLQYKDFAIWQNQQIEGEAMKKQEAYWREQFAGEIPMLRLLTDFPRAEMVGHDGDIVRFTLNPELTVRLYDLAARQGVTLFMTLLAIYTILLGKMAGQDEIIIGTPVAGRQHVDVQTMIGVFLNTLALRNQPTGEKRFDEFLAEVKDHTLKAYENQDYPFDQLVEALDLPVEPGTNPLFQVMLVLQNQDRPIMELEGLEWVPYEVPEMAAKFDFTLYVSESPEGLQMALNYRTNLFLRESMVRMCERWIAIAESVVANPAILLADLEAVSGEEEQMLLTDFNEDLDDDF